MKILFVHSGTDLYGASRSLLRLSTRLVKDGNIVVVGLPGEGPLNQELLNLGIRVYILNNLTVITRNKYQQKFNIIKFLFNFLGSTLEIIKIIDKEKPDLVHTMTAVLPSSGLAAKITGTPHFWHIRESFSEFSSLWKVYQYYIAILSEKVLCVSGSISQQFGTKIAKKTIVIHNGFPIQEFLPVSLDRISKIKKLWNATSQQINVGVVGRIKFQRKGQEIFVQAAAIIKNKFPNAKFLCIGSPFPGNEDHLERLLNLVKEVGLEDAFIYTGEAEDIKAAISSLDILVLSSVLPEPFGGVVIEAMAFRKPVIASATGGSLEQVVDKSTGFLVEPGDPYALAKAMEKLLEDPVLRKEMGENGYQRFIDCFEFESFYKKMITHYQRVIRI